MAQKVKGVTDIINRLNKFGSDGARMAVAITNQTAQNISNKAKTRAPVDLGALRQSIGNTQATVQSNRSIIYANETYAPFVEFGTGGKVQVPTGFEELAIEFKGKNFSNGLSFLEAIRAWCRSKGIPESAAYPIMLKLLNVGMTPEPFLIPAYKEESKKYPERLKKAYDKLTRDFNNKK